MLKTPRLYLRNLRQSDALLIHAWRNDPDCARYQRWEASDAESVAAYVERFARSCFLSTQEEQHYAVCDHKGIVGEVSYFYTEEDRCVTLGITIAPEHQRKGYASEAAAACVQYAFAHNDFPAVYCYMKYTNIPSQKTAMKIGMTFVEEFPDPDNFHFY